VRTGRRRREIISAGEIKTPPLFSSPLLSSPLLSSLLSSALSSPLLCSLLSPLLSSLLVLLRPGEGCQCYRLTMN